MQETDDPRTRRYPGGVPQSTRAALALRELILSGELAAGDRVSEVPLSERVGVSRTPLRLALARLEHDGLLEMLPSGGFAVRQFTREDVNDAIELRGVLEGTAARFAAERLTDAHDLADLRECAAQIEPLVRDGAYGMDELGRYIELNDRFHALFHELGRSDVLRREIERVFALPFGAPDAFVRVHADLPASREVLVVAQAQHHALIEAIGAREGSRAESIAREHARLARRNLDIAMGSERELERVQGAALIRRPAAE
jgi:GntR family transcriptional regulator, vanillate catabolism transcriptional regulator